MQACVRHCEGLLGIERQVGIAESNLQMCEETKHIRDVQRNQMGVGLCLQQLICPSFFIVRGVHISMKLAMREPDLRATETCNAESNSPHPKSIQSIRPASVAGLILQGR